MTKQDAEETKAIINQIVKAEVAKAMDDLRREFAALMEELMAPKTVPSIEGPGDEGGAS